MANNLAVAHGLDCNKRAEQTSATASKLIRQLKINSPHDMCDPFTNVGISAVITTSTMITICNVPMVLAKRCEAT